MDKPVVLITGALTGIGRAAAVAFAKKGAKLYAVVRVLSTGHRRMRLYAVNSGGLTRIDQLVSAGLFEELVAKLAYDADKVDYNGFDHTDGVDVSGFGWPKDSYSNVALGVIYALADVIHGDRNAWTVESI